MDVAETETTLTLSDPRRGVAGAIVLALAAVVAVVLTPAATAQSGLIGFLGSLLGAGLLAVWGILILSQAKATFDARTRLLTVDRGRRWKNRAWSAPWSEIRSLYLVRSSDPEGGRPGALMFVDTTSGSIQLSLTVFDPQSAETAITAAGRFLKENDTAVSVETRLRQFPRKETLSPDPN
ncbi:MAG: hypothetical protein AAFR35_08860 [Pseudomonadota bacterium]